MEAESVRMRHERSKYNEVLDLMEILKETKIRNNKVTHYHYIPSELSPRFWSREDALEAIEKVLGTDEKPRFLKTFALYGMGGVGKTQIALHYANKNRENYETILWVVADNVISTSQSFREIAKLLGLSQSDQEMQDTAAATLKVKNWLTDARKCPILL
jgi:Cdc6-like AAA superfamily ATPase